MATAETQGDSSLALTPLPCARAVAPVHTVPSRATGSPSRTVSAAAFPLAFVAPALRRRDVAARPFMARRCFQEMQMITHAPATTGSGTPPLRSSRFHGPRRASTERRWTTHLLIAVVPYLEMALLLLACRYLSP